MATRQIWRCEHQLMATLLSKNKDQLMVIIVASCENKDRSCIRHIVILL